MKIVKYILFPVVLLLLSLKPASHTKSDEDCKETLIGYMDFLNSMNEFKGDKVYYMEYTTESKFSKEANLPNVKTTTKVLSSKDRITIEDDNMQVYGNRSYVFVILPKLKRVYLNNSDPKIFEKNNSYAEMLKIQKVLLESAKNVSCEEKAGMKTFNVLPDKEFAKKMKLLRQNISYNLKEKRVFRVENIFNQYSKMSKQIIQYDVLEFDSKRKILDPEKYFFNGEELKPKFKSYEIVDNRNT